MNTTDEMANSSSENTFQSFAELQETQARERTCVGKGSAALQASVLCLLQGELPFLQEEGFNLLWE